MDGQIGVSTPPKQDQSPIDSVLGQLENNIDILNQNLDKLSSMMQPVMREPETTPEEAKGGVSQPSKIGQRIQKASLAISGMTDCVQHLQSRLQI